MKLSVLYVVCNEQDLLPKSVQSIRHIADEVVVVDTGSQDKTKEVARQLSCRVLHHAWVHDFSKVRNFGVGACKGEWVLYLDADEMLDPRSATEVRKAAETAKTNVMAFGLNVVDYDADMGWSTPPNEEPFFRSPQVRLFRKTPSVHFSGKVLESVVPSLNGATNILGATVHHWLWKGKGKDYKELKLSYYKKLGASFDERTEKRLETRAMEMPLPTKSQIKEGEQVAIVTCAYNAIDHTKACLQSLTSLTHQPYLVYFVDNGSTDGTYGFASSFLGRNPIRFPRNQGIPKARNAGTRAALSDPRNKYVCFLDNDVKVTSGWLEKMVRVMEKHPDIGLLAPLSQSGSGAQAAKQLAPKDGQGETDEAKGETGAPVYTDFVERFCMLVRAELFQKIGFFDESFGPYGSESNDFCMRVARSGLRVAVASNVFVWHAGGATLSANPVDWNQVKIGSAQRFRNKYHLFSTDEAMKPSATFVAKNAFGPSAGSGPAPNPPTSIVVLGCNRVDMTVKCIDSILTHTANFELIFVDNNSKDGTQNYISGLGDQVRYIRNDKNLGVPMGRNQGILASTKPFIVLLDNDCVVKSGWLQEFFSKMPSGGGVVGLEAWRLGKDWAPTGRCFSQNEQFDYLGGACCLFSRNVFEKVGLYDEGFSPAYFEDTDMSVRAKAGGFRLVWLPTHLVLHEEHATLIHGGQKDFSYQEAMGRSYTRFAAKMEGSLKVEHRKLEQTTKKLNILYLGMQYDYGQKQRGNSFEHDNFYSSMREWKHLGQLTYFDFVDLSQSYGVEAMSNMLQDAVQKQQPDALFCIFFNEQTDPRKDVVGRITNTTKAKTIGWFCDSHFRYENFDRPWAQHLSFCVTTSTQAESKYHRDGLSSKVIKSQWAAAPCYRRIDGVKKDVPVSFVGQPHSNRRQIIHELRVAGIPVQAYGTGWEKRLSFDEMVMMFNRSLINLNLNNSADQTTRQIKGRNFEVPACGGFLLTDVAENLSDYYAFGREIDTYAGTPQMIEKIRHYLAHPEEANEIAKAAYERTMAEHTYSHRFNDIFTKAGLI